MKRLAIVAVLLLAACGAPPKSVPPAPIFRDPLAGVATPAPPAALGPRPASLVAAADALLAQVCRLSAYVVEAVPLLAAAKGELAALPLYPECDAR